MKKLSIAFLVMLLAACGGTTDAPPATPTGLKATAAEKSVKLEWNPNTEADLKGYVVSVSLSDGALVGNFPVVAPATQMNVTNLIDGTAYTFRLAAEDKAGNRSAFSSPLQATAGAPGTPPTRPSGLTASAQNEQVLLTWNKNPEPDLKGYTLYYGPSATSLNQSKTLSGEAVNTVVAGLTNGTPSFFALEAENNAGQKSPRTEVVAATPQAALLAPIVSGLSISGYGASTQVRQGAGGIEVLLQGQRLETLTSVKLLGGFDFTIVEKTASSAKLSAIVPHGLEVGTRTLLVSGTGGELALSDALEITRITAAKTPGLNPSDTTGLGTPNKPYLTLSRALADAASGDTVLLGAGTYGAGESWPQSSTSSLALPPPNIPAGITLEGQSSDRGAVLLQGAGKTNGSSGLVFAGNATVRNLTLRDFRFALVLNAGTASNRVGDLLLENLTAFESLEGLTLNFAQSVTLNKVSLNNNTNGGLTAQAVRQLNISQSEFSGNTYGIAAGNATTGGPLDSSLTINQATVNQNTQFGISSSVATDLSNVTAKLNTTYGLRLLGKPGFVALRTGTSLGGTSLEQNGQFQLFDARDANQGSFNATRYLLPGSSVTVGAVVGPTQSGNFYRITNAGNSILFQ